MEVKSEFKQCGCKKHVPCTCGKREHVYGIGEMPKRMYHHEVIKHDHHEVDHCPEKVKGFNLCRRRNELRCFKQCEPVSQPCDGLYYNYFTNRTNFEFSGLIVVTNTGNPTSGCAMSVRITDRANNLGPVTISPGASVPFFVEGLVALDIACIETETPAPPFRPTCSGEIIFDLEYCASKVCF